MTRILLIEDSFLIGRELRRDLESFGAEVSGPFSSENEWRESSDTAPYDLAVLDICIRGGRSYGIADDMRSRGVPVIFVTGFTRLDDVPAALKNSPRLTKPIDRELMKRVVEELIETSTGT